MTSAVDLPRALQDPATYAHSPHHAVVPAAIGLCETHISWVALAGNHAYKVKKPVKFDFLDYGTLEQRRRACEAELNLNRRWAPALYEGLSRFARSARGLAADGDGEILEYAVRMRRFAAEDTLDALIARRALDVVTVEALGRDIAATQARAPHGDPSAGTPAEVRETCLDNLRALGERGPPLPDRIRGWLDEHWAAVARTLAARRAEGRVRECHGDLHCANVVRLDGTLIPFDGIEFSDRLRTIDVASDVAFLLMDLAARGRRELEVAALRGWLGESGDLRAAEVLPFFHVHRALVRARIASLQPAGGAGARAAPSSADYVQAALATTERAPGRLLLMHGASGSGKSSVAAGLAARWPAIVLRSDTARRSHPKDAQRYAPARRAQVYEQLAVATHGWLRAGYDVIVDATFLELDPRRRFLGLARALGCRVAILCCTAPTAELRRRILARRGDASEATPAVLDAQLATAAPLAGGEQALALTVATEAEIDWASLRRSLEARLAAAPAGD